MVPILKIFKIQENYFVMWLQPNPIPPTLIQQHQKWLPWPSVGGSFGGILGKETLILLPRSNLLQYGEIYLDLCCTWITGAGLHGPSLLEWVWSAGLDLAATIAAKHDVLPPLVTQFLLSFFICYLTCCDQPSGIWSCTQESSSCSVLLCALL